MPTLTLEPTGPPPSSISPRLDDPSLDVMRRAFAQTLKDGHDPRVMLSFERSTIEEHGDLWYVVVRAHDSRIPPIAVYRLFNDFSLKGLARYPRPIRDEIENAEVLLAASVKKAKS